MDTITFLSFLFINDYLVYLQNSQLLCKVLFYEMLKRSKMCKKLIVVGDGGIKKDDYNNLQILILQQEMPQFPVL